MEDTKHDDEWQASLEFDIHALRNMYNHVLYSIQMWPGYPARPAEEQMFLMDLKHQLFVCLMEYNLTHGTTEQQ